MTVFFFLGHDKGDDANLQPKKVPHSVLIHVFRCFTSWLKTGLIRLQEIERQPVMIEAFRILQDTNAESSLHEAATDCVCSLLVRMETSEEMDINNCMCTQLELNVYTAVGSFRATSSIIPSHRIVLTLL